MTPQLRQAIHLLQLSTLDLKTEVQEALDSNLMLEDAGEEGSEEYSEESFESLDSNTPDNSAVTENASGPDQTAQQSESSNSQSDSSQSDSSDPQANEPATTASGDAEVSNTGDQAEIPDELPMDAAWDDIYDSGQTSYSAPAADDDSRDIFESSRTVAEDTLQDHLNWQLELTPFSDLDRQIADAIIDSINDDGYLGVTVEDIHQGFLAQLMRAGMDPEQAEQAIDLSEVEAVLHRIQQFDPIGVGSRDLSECLVLQLVALPEETPNRQTALLVVKRYLEMLGSRDLKQLMRRVKIDADTLNDIIKLIRSLDPKPGARFTPNDAQYIVPDVFVRKVKDTWLVEPNTEAMPRLKINSLYASLVKRADNSPDNTYLKNNLQEARWFIKSLKSRHETLLKVANAIVDRQTDFLDQGEEGMKPLVLRDIAEAVEMHESTISRVTTQKFMHTPRGIYEFKFFFSSHVGTSDGGECSATAIRAMIKKMTAAESPSKPLSDNKIANILGEQGIKVARRTVAKYRESMGIPPSNERKRLS